MIVHVEGLAEVTEAMENLSKAANRNVCRKALRAGGVPIRDAAQQAAPKHSGVLRISIAISDRLTRRQKRTKPKVNEVEMYVGPSTGQGATFYASHVEYGTEDTPIQPYMRPAWDGQREHALDIIAEHLRIEVRKAAQRAQRKAARLIAATGG